MSAWLKRVVSGASTVGTAVPLLLLAGILAGFGATQPANMADLTGECTPVMRDMVGTPCWSPERPVTDGAAALGEAAEVAALTEGMECWAASEGRLGSHVVVRSEVGVVLLPLTQDVWDAAGRGEFETIKGCQA